MTFYVLNSKRICYENIGAQLSELRQCKSISFTPQALNYSNLQTLHYPASHLVDQQEKLSSMNLIRIPLKVPFAPGLFSRCNLSQLPPPMSHNLDRLPSPLYFLEKGPASEIPVVLNRMEASQQQPFLQRDPIIIPSCTVFSY